MPELPEIEHLRRTLRPALAGRVVGRVSLRRRDIVRCPVRAGPRDLLAGRAITRLARRGKQLALIAGDGAVVCVHLGMSGQLLVVGTRKRIADPRHVHCLWHLHEADGRPAGRLVFRDPRRFGGLWSYPSVARLRRERWGLLGPDALALSGLELASRVARSRRPIKAALLDQHVVAGVGNIYADEALFEARIEPTAEAGGLTRGELDRLANAIIRVMRAAIGAGGSTLRDYVDANGASGRFGLAHRVYGRAGEPCVSCGIPLAVATVAQRTTVWCPACQVRRSDRGVLKRSHRPR